MHFLFVCGLFLINSVRCDGDVEDIVAAYNRLRDDLKKNYDPYARPVLYNSNVTKVKIALHLVSSFILDEDVQTIDIDSYMSMNWDDHHLTWNPDSYAHIAGLQMSPNDIWMPDIYEIYNGGDSSKLQESDFNIVLVDHTGNVAWIFATVLLGRCTFDYKNFPSDTAVCKFILKAWSYKGDAVDVDALVFDYRHEEETPKQINPQWELTGMTGERKVWKPKCCGFYPSAQFTMTITRKGPIPQQQLIWITSVIVILLTLGMFWIPSDIEQKMTVGCAVMLIMTAALVTVASTFRARQPIILIVGTVHNFMYVTTAAILLEIIAINLQHIQEWKPPEFLLNIFSGTVGKFLLISSAQQERPALDKMKLSEYESGDVMLEQLLTIGNWKTISQALDRVSFILYVIILSAIPKSP